MKTLTRIGTFALAAAMCTAMAVPAFAAESKKAEREETRAAWSACKETVESNQSTLSTLKGENQKRMTQIVVLQNQLKQDGTLTEANRAELSELSAAIQQQRLSLGDIREEVKALKESGRASMKGGDKQAAITAFEEAAALQDEQIAVQKALSGLLGQKLDYLNSCASGRVVETPVEPEAKIPDETAEVLPVEVPEEIPSDEMAMPEETIDFFEEILDDTDDEISDEAFDALLEQALQI